MSIVDTSLGAETREAYLDEVRYWLPSLLSSASDERTSAIESVEALLHLDRTDLRRVIAVHLLLDESVQQFVASLRHALRKPMTRSERPRELSRVISGGIDWAATVRARSTGSPVEGGFVTRPARRLWDIEENRVLAWVLKTLSRELEFALAIVKDSKPAGWQASLANAGDAVRQARRTAWLGSVLAERPSAAAVAQLDSSRSLFYRNQVSRVAKLLRRYSDDPSPSDVVDLLARRWFEPSRDWALFELVVLLRLERALAGLGTRRRVRLLTVSSAFSVIDVAPGQQVRLWYQNWPERAGASEQLEAAKHYSISTTGSRPDILIEVRTGGSSKGILIECKASRSSRYLGEGLMQMLGYMRDRPALFGREACAWLVAPAGPSFTSQHAEGRELWVASVDEVADAAIAAVSALLQET